MKLFLLPSDANGDRNPILEAGIFRHLPLVASMREADAVVVPICYMHGYAFNPELAKVDKPVVLLDFMEYGWNAGDAPNLWGYALPSQFQHINSTEWQKLDEWVASLGQFLTFKRELFQRDVSDFRLPIEFPCLLPIPPTEEKEQFLARRIECFSNWGDSHPIRQRMHGRIFCGALGINAHVVDGWTQQIEDRTWATIHVPHYERKPHSEIMRWQSQSKASISLPGAGVKCFRSAEAPIGSVPVMLQDELAWSYPWTDYENCIRIDQSCDIQRLAQIIREPDLIYLIYAQAQETIRKYEVVRYVREYVLPNIESRL